MRSSRLLGGRGIDDRVVELYAGLKAGLRGRRIGCGAPQMHLGREPRFNGARVVLPNTSESSPGILALASYVQQDSYINSTSPGLKMSQCSPECSQEATTSVIMSQRLGPIQVCFPKSEAATGLVVGLLFDQPRCLQVSRGLGVSPEPVCF